MCSSSAMPRASSRRSTADPTGPVWPQPLCDGRTVGNLLRVSTPNFRLVCGPAALDGAPEGWATDLLVEGHASLLIDDGGVDAISAAAHALDAEAVTVLRHEATQELQEATVRKHAHGLPVIWISKGFSDDARRWAKDRGQMTLLVESEGALSEDERGTIGRFVAMLGRQTD